MAIGASCQVAHFFNVIRHHDECRLVHPAKWEIGKFQVAFVTDVDWCIPSGSSFDISFNSHLWRIPFDESRPYHHSHSFGFQIAHFNFIFTFILYFQRYTQSMYLFHILIHILISYTHSYTHSRTHFIYSFMYSFHSYLVNYQNT